MSVLGVILVRIFPHSDIFHAVVVLLTVQLPKSYGQLPLKVFISLICVRIKAESIQDYIQISPLILKIFITLSQREPLSYRNQFTDLLRKSVAGFYMITASVMKGLSELTSIFPEIIKQPFVFWRCLGE